MMRKDKKYVCKSLQKGQQSSNRNASNWSVRDTGLATHRTGSSVREGEENDNC